jgi:hypothetical protein
LKNAAFYDERVSLQYKQILLSIIGYTVQAIDQNATRIQTKVEALWTLDHQLSQVLLTLFYIPINFYKIFLQIFPTTENEELDVPLRNKGDYVLVTMHELQEIFGNSVCFYWSQNSKFYLINTTFGYS